MQYYTYFGSTYGSGSYDSSTFNGATTTSTGGSTGSSAAGGTTTATGSTGSASAGGSVLTNTGFDVAASATLACVIIVAAIIVRVWRRPVKQEN